MELLKPQSGDLQSEYQELSDKRAFNSSKLNEIKQTREQIGLAVNNIERIINDSRNEKQECIQLINQMEREISMLQERINQASQSSNETSNRYHIS